MNRSLQLGDKDLRRSVSVLTSEINMNNFTYTELVINCLTIISFLSSVLVPFC